MEIAWVSPRPGSDRLVLLALAWRAPKGKTEATAPVRDLASLSGLSQDQTRRVLHRLAQDGVIRCTQQGGGRQAATYELTPCTGARAGADARAPLAKRRKGTPGAAVPGEVKGKSKNSPSARVRAPVGGLAIDRHGITHKPGDERDAEALSQIAQHTPQAIAAAVGVARQADPLGRAFPSKVLRLLITPAPPTPRPSAQATPAWALAADWLN